MNGLKIIILAVASLMMLANRSVMADLVPEVASPCVLGIDIGHTRGSPGATSARGVSEWVFNRRLAGEIDAAVNASGVAKSFLINATGDSLELSDRPRLAQEGHATIFLSIHHDSAQPKYFADWVDEGKKRRYSDNFSGYSLFVSGKNPQYEVSVEFAKAVGVEFAKKNLRPTLHHAEAISGENRPLIDKELGIYRYDGLAVLRTAALPAVLLEAGVIVNRDEERRLTDPSYRKTIVEGIVNAVRTYCAK